MSVDRLRVPSVYVSDMSNRQPAPLRKHRTIAMRLRSSEVFCSLTRRATGPTPLSAVASKEAFTSVRPDEEMSEATAVEDDRVDDSTKHTQVDHLLPGWHRPRASLDFVSAQLCEPNQRRNRLWTNSNSMQTATIMTTATIDIYPALLSGVALEFRNRVSLSDRMKNSIEYRLAFDGEEATDKLMAILNTEDRGLALRLGRALGAQRLFHDVTYETRLVDSSSEIYQFNTWQNDTLSCDTPISESTQSSQSSVTEDGVASFKRFPHGVFTELTRCFSPSCVGSHACYSYTCPKREAKERPGSHDSRMASSTTHMCLRESSQELWADMVPLTVRDTISSKELKRQESIHELLTTERNFVMDLGYIIKMWIQPLRRDTSLSVHFVDRVFSNITDIYRINARFAQALWNRQQEHAIVYQIGDIVLDYVVGLEPFVNYGAQQHEARFTFEHERLHNPRFMQFVEQTERHPSSHKLELNGYLTKPTTRLGRYTLLLNEILKHTREDHPDNALLTQSVQIIKQFLARVNAEAGKAKNRFDLQRIHHSLRFKNKADEIDLKLLEDGRQVIKQGMLRKTASHESTNYQVILFDNYLVIVKVKTVDGEEYHVIQKRPIPIELLSITLPETKARRACSHVLPARTTEELPLRMSVDISSRCSRIKDQKSSESTTLVKSGYPVNFQHRGRGALGSFVLFAPSVATRKPWIDAIQKLQATKAERLPVFRTALLVDENVFHVGTEIHHSVTFGGGLFYLLATDLGVYVGHNRTSSSPRRVLVLEKVTQVYVLEAHQVLLVLADKTLWEYSLEVVNGKSSTGRPPEGRKVQVNVPFIHVGTSLQRTLVCIPRVSPLKSTITLYEPSKPQILRRHSIMGRLSQTRAGPSPFSLSSGVHLKRFKDCYIPSEVWAMELSRSQLLITCPRGIIMVDLHSCKPQHMLNPNDKHLSFVTEREKNDNSLSLRAPIKRIAVFRIPQGPFIVCYDEFAFLIDGKGNRVSPDFLIEWEGRPESFAFSYPYVMAFEPSFIEVRNILTGHIEQIIRGSHIRCLNNGHRTELRTIFGTMSSPSNESYKTVFSLLPLDDLPHTPQSL